MAQFLVRNSLNPSKVIRLGVTFRKVVALNRSPDGDAIWIVEVATDEPHINGGGITPVIINLISMDKFDDEMQKAVTTISAQVDWENLIDDARAPYVDSVFPAEYLMGIENAVEFVVKETLPSAGIDINSVTLTVNEYDVTDELEIAGSPYEYNVKWRPEIKIYNTY